MEIELGNECHIMKNRFTLRSFCEIGIDDFKNQLLKKIHSYIEEKGKNYIKNVEEKELIYYLEQEYSIEPLSIDQQSERITDNGIYKKTLSRYDGYYDNTEIEIYTFTIYYNFSGSPVLFRIKPNPWVMAAEEIEVNEFTNEVSFTVKISRQDPVLFKREKDQVYHRAFANLDNVNTAIPGWNSSLRGIISGHLRKLKDKYSKEDAFHEAIGIKINPSTSSVFTPPTIKKAQIPSPVVSRKSQSHSEPTMNQDMYEDVLKITYEVGKNMEKKPSLYMNKDEEGLRDQFLLFLETRYEGVSGTAETFNRNGKTDILLKYAKDGSNLFIAECKFWHGAAEFHKAINQLLGYLSWRDSKSSLILFVKNKELSSVLKTVKTEVTKHPNFVKHLGDKGESSFSYKFNLPTDKAKELQLEIIAFHFDK